MSLSASHLQKLSLSFQLTTPLGQTFDPQQVGRLWIMLLLLGISDSNSEQRPLLQSYLKLKHESGVEHVFIVGRDDKKFKLILVKRLF